MYLDGLNGRQKEAVLATRGPVSVLAGAGSGKTRVLTTRIYHLIREGTPPEKILAVTFTNKAAREMRERVRKMLGAEPQAPRPSELQAPGFQLPFIATFHGLGRELLESYGTAIGVPRFFSIWDRDDSEKAIAAALKALDVDTKELSPRAVLGRISKAKGAGMTASEFREKNGRASFGARIVSEAWASYEQALKKEKALDFDDLIALPVRLLEEHADVRAKAQERWNYMLIDEYQDTSVLQSRLVNVLVAKHRNVFACGDIDQCIYTWRQATIENLLNFEKDYPDAKTIVLEHNYRSTKTIVDSANAVIEKNVNRKEKRSSTDNPEGKKILIHVAPNAEAEARFVAGALLARIREGEEPESMAVLFRTNFQSRGLEEALLRTGVPYRILGTRYFDRKEVKDMLAWVRLCLEPSRETDKIRAAQAPSRGIGKVTLAKLAAGQRAELRAGEKAKVEAFEAVVAELARAAETASPSEFVRLVVEKSGLEKALSEGSEEDKERLENIRELGTLASRHDALPGKEGIAAFLAEAALASDQDEMDRNEK
ncbi:MAG: UvrD-helicase domain-containing protein, partial [Patescibacteria group bacterium]|nr:UvrD-helicase domain-containing protein [Patescibacteria group bacterium]